MCEFKEPTFYSDYKNQNVVGWGMSEKLNGVWARWTGSEFLTRNGNKLHAPKSFTEGLPDLVLEGELWLGYGQFQKICSIVKRSKEIDWQGVSFNVFDVVAKGSYSDRMSKLDSVNFPTHVSIVKQIVVESKEQIDSYLEEVLNRGGEGLVIRDLSKKYISGLTNCVLKNKPRPDDEAVIVGFTDAKGTYEGLIGALIVDFNGKTFKLAVNAIVQTMQYKNLRECVGKKVTFSFLELTGNGIPSQAAFIGVRDYE